MRETQKRRWLWLGAITLIAALAFLANESVASGEEIAQKPSATEKPVDAPFTSWIRPEDNPLVQIGAIILATFALEDAAAIAVGLFVKRGMINPYLGMGALFLGIFLGDLGLYLLGRIFGAACLRWRPVRRALPVKSMELLGEWLNRTGWLAIFASRVVPGTRWPLYVAAGACRCKPFRFAVWTFLAALIWVPIIVYGTVLLGPYIAQPFHALFGDSWFAFIAAIVAMLVLLRIVGLLLTRDGRRRVISSIGRMQRWEFWPTWAIYWPLFPWFAWMSLRYRGFRTVSAVNPCWDDGGMIGESKIAVMPRFSANVQPRFVALDPVDHRIDSLIASEAMRDAEMRLPVVVKPDSGERGAGVRFCDTEESLNAALEEAHYPIIIQERAPQGCEVGVFWYRFPGDQRGRIFSITEKVFPVVVGDGEKSIRELTWEHERYWLQYRVFKKRFGARFDQIPEKGEVVQLARSGNHCQGTMFKEGGHLRTRELELAIEEICRGVEGYYFGRLDICCNSEEALKRGEGLVMIEANGLSSESSNMYDPSIGIWKAWSIIRSHWRVAATIGGMNRKIGVRGIGYAQLLWRLLWVRRKSKRAPQLAD